MATLNYHSNQSFWAIAIKKHTKFLEAYTKNISAKSHSFWEDDLLRYFFLIYFSFWLPWQPIKMSSGHKNIICLIEDHSRNISVKVLSKYLQWLNNNTILYFPIISLWQLWVTIAAKVWPIFIKKKKKKKLKLWLVSGWMLQMKFGLDWPSRLRGDVV